MSRGRDVVMVLAPLALVASLAVPACSSEESQTAAEASGTASSSGATASSGPGGPVDGGLPVDGGDYLALPCEDDSVCGEGGTCIRATDDVPLGGGPAGGYCSRVCSEDAECPGLYSVCIRDDVTGAGRCFLACEVGPPPNGASEPLDRDKCLGRDDLRCGEPISTLGLVRATVCLPTCGQDAQCPPGRMCDPRRRVCVTTPHTGLPFGEPCELRMEQDECAGLCRQFGNAYLCTSHCVFGGASFGHDCGGLDAGFCSTIPLSYGTGDEGTCVAACDEQDDCLPPAVWCKTTYQDNSGHYAHCSKNVDSCNPGPCKPGKGTCTQTKHGWYCLEAEYPLGSAAP